jgi:hypothetical protein
MGRPPKLTVAQQAEARRRPGARRNACQARPRLRRGKEHDFTPHSLDVVSARAKQRRDRRNIPQRQADPLRKSKRAPRRVSLANPRRAFRSDLAGLSRMALCDFGRSAALGEIQDTDLDLDLAPGHHPEDDIDPITRWGERAASIFECAELDAGVQYILYG